MSLNPTKECSNKQQLLNETSGTYNEELVVVVGQPVDGSVGKVDGSVGEPVNDSGAHAKPKSCCHRFREAEGSIFSKCAFFSIGGFFTYMSILACTSICAFASLNSAFSVLSVNSVASIASVNSVLSIGSVNCYECVFNYPLQGIADRTSNTCKKYSLEDGAYKSYEKSLYGLAYRTFKPAQNSSSEEDLVNDCCLFIHSTEAKTLNVEGFILNPERTACLVYGGEHGEGSLDRTDVDTAEYAFKPCLQGEICQ